MTLPVNPDASQQAAVEAALVLLERMGLSPADLAAVPQPRKPVPTFAEYVPVVSAAVSDGTRRAYGTYWNRITGHWGDRRLDEPTPSEIRQLMTYIKTHAVARRNARGGRSAQEHLVAALRCLYQRAIDDGLIAEADNPARKVAETPAGTPQQRITAYLEKFTQEWPKYGHAGYGQRIMASVYQPGQIAEALLADAEFRALKLGTWLNTPSRELLVNAVATLDPKPFNQDVDLLIEALQLAAQRQHDEARQKLALGLLGGAALAIALGSSRSY